MVVNIKHIIDDNKDRFPEPYKSILALGHELIS